MLRWPQELLPGLWSVARWRHLTITALAHIIILIIQAPIIRQRRPAIMLRALVLRQVEMRSLTASNVSDRTIQKPEFMSGQTTVSIHALDRCNRRQLAALDSCRIERSGIPTARGGQWSAVEVQLVINRAGAMTSPS